MRTLIWKLPQNPLTMCDRVVFGDKGGVKNALGVVEAVPCASDKAGKTPKKP